ncbi:hypothetical protein QOZ80_5BG0428790 [Eleusine coracana subsp. coracana]|nr:hypothetical protein QOZ80_5BG0428790 [Eleusine coracana subsp. coracana]
MGNCLVIQDRKEIKIMRVDGSKVLKMPPLKIQQEALDEPLTGHSIPGVLPASAVADPGAVRVKLVISKQELNRMLEKEGMSLDDIVSAMRKGTIDGRESEHECCGGWRPALESIPEGSGF